MVGEAAWKAVGRKAPRVRFPVPPRFKGDEMFVEPLPGSIIFLMVVAIIAMVICLTFSNLEKRDGKKDNRFKEIYKAAKKEKRKRWRN